MPVSDRTALERQLLDALPFAVLATDTDGRVVYANPRAGERDAVTGRHVATLLPHADGGDAFAQAFERLHNGTEPVVRWETGGTGGGDESATMQVQVTAWHGDDGHVAGFVVATADASESSRARDALIATGLALSTSIDLDRVYREVSQQLRRALRIDALVIAVADDDTLALTAVQVAGYGDAREAIETRLRPDWLEALAWGDAVVHACGPGGREVTAPIISEEGILGAITVRSWWLEGAQEVEEARRVLRTVAAQTAAAIDRSFLVRRVEQKRRLEAIGEVAAGVAHELRNPLFGISSAAQLLRLRAKDDPAVDRNVTRILREVERLNGMLSSLLEYGRPQPLVMQDGDPDAAWDEVLEANRQRLVQANLVLVRQRPERPVSARFDHAQVGQVLLNILVNAIDAAPAGSTLTLHSTVLPNGAWRCRLQNWGPPIPADALPRVFEIFFSLKSGGTGIGLALCKRIMEEHGGAIAIESGPDTGTAVSITLPAAPAPAADAPERA
jgi:PAS domain S-box-containing protein